jgi:hypothetical protein
VQEERLRQAEIRRAAFPRELAAAAEAIRPLVEREELQAAVEAWKKERARHEDREWVSLTSAKIEELRRKAEELFEGLRRDAAGLEAARARARVAKWGYADLRDELEKLLAAAVPGPREEAPPEPSPAAKAYLSAWTRAMSRVPRRDFDGAAAELRTAARESGDDAVRKEAGKDAEDLAGMAALAAEALKALPVEPGQTLTVELWNEEGAKRRLSGRVLRSDAVRAELADAFVEYGDATAATLVAALARKRRLTADEERLGVLLRALEGDAPPSARHRAVPVPPLPPREAEARKLYYAAEREFRDPETLAQAVGKFRALAAEYGDTRLVGGSIEGIRRRAEGAREQVLGASAFRASGAFKEGVHEKAGRCWTCAEDVTREEARSTWVEFRFPALAETAYQAWIYAGACCAETFDLYVQGTELSGPNPARRTETVQAPIDGSAALPLPHGLRFLKSTHAAHGGPKQASRWGWIAVPLPRYSQAGLKRIRIFSDQKGFSVALAVVSATRKEPPGDAETKAELAKAPEVPPPPAPDARPWKPLFDGKTTDCLKSDSVPHWTVENGALFRLADRADSAQTRELVGDGEVRIRFETRPGDYVSFRLRQGAEGSYSVNLENALLESLKGKPHEVIVALKGDEVTATLDGKPVAVVASGRPRLGHIQLGGSALRILAMEVRAAP